MDNVVVPIAKAREPKTSKMARRSPLATAREMRGRSGTPGPFPTSPGQRQVLEPVELRTFFKTMPATSKWYPYFFLQYIFSMRLSEPALLCDDDINFKKRTIKVKRLRKIRDEVRESNVDETEEFDEISYDLVGDSGDKILEAARVMQRWKEKTGTTANPFLFASNRRRETENVGAERLSQLRNLDGWQAVSRFTAHRVFQRVTADAKWPDNLRNAHVLRHTRAVFMLAAGVSLEEVGRVCGHSTVKMTERYVPIAFEWRRRFGIEAF